jgi:low temperature requirement protein LtrA
MATPSSEGTQELQPLPLLGNPLKLPSEHHNAKPKDGSPSDELAKLPTNRIWKHYKETTNIELYYDLYFVANLTSFTSQHEIDNRHSLSDYIGFFCILWFTWLQVALFDMRFETNSFFDRFCKALQLAVMGGFAVTGWNYHPSEGRDSVHLHYFFTFSLILMASRLALCLQYLKVACFARAFRSRTKQIDGKIVLPLLLVMLSKLVSGSIYLGVSFGFLADHPRMKGYFSWYIVAIAETLFDFVVSFHFPVINYQNTHMVERMTLITLIILGEGIIGMTEATSTVFSSVGVQDGGKIIGQLVCGFLINYFLYLLYSDRVKEKEVGPVRQQVWSFFHFPFHISLVLLLAAVKVRVFDRRQSV